MTREIERPEVVEGYLVVQFPRPIPALFWKRIRERIASAGLEAEFAADYRAENEAVRKARAAGTGWTPREEEFEREERLFRRWVERVVGPQALWPWQRGWTEDLVDSYLDRQEARAA